MAINNSFLLSAYLTSRRDARLTNDQLIDYYEKAGPDYETWSPNFNMHFGYFEKGMNPFNREAMLHKMNEVVLSMLGIDPNKSSYLVDMGCGLAATLRDATRQYPLLNGSGVTIVPWQKKKADHLNQKSEETQRIEVLLEDYTNTSFARASVDHVIAIESSCYAPGANKALLLKEIHRILKPGGSFVIADGFLKTNQPLKGLLKAAYHQLCRSWALDELGEINEVKTELDALNFSHVEVKDVSWRVAPSVAHVPFTVMKFLLRQLVSKSAMNRERWDNLKSPLLTMVLGLHQSRFGYFLIKGIK